MIIGLNEEIPISIGTRRAGLLIIRLNEEKSRRAGLLIIGLIEEIPIGIELKIKLTPRRDFKIGMGVIIDYWLLSVVIERRRNVTETSFI